MRRGAGGGGGLTSYPNMLTIDRRPPPCGFREGLGHVAGSGWGPPLRDDLIVAPQARHMGFVAEREGPTLGDLYGFAGPGVAVWMAADGWQARSTDPEGRAYGPRRVYGGRGTSLLTALLGEAPRLLAPPEAPTATEGGTA